MTIFDINYTTVFLDPALCGQNEMKSKNVQTDPIKLKAFAISKGTISKMKDNLAIKRKFAKMMQAYDKGLSLKIYKQLIQQKDE